mmetsp:Transcript_23503/g.36239  ORF Transcript_23503/g.36239 Transcript_23503/m.36239 type:complete len:241 (+) Transcript_23503:46-768(+)
MHTLRCIGKITPLAYRIVCINSRVSAKRTVVFWSQQNVHAGGGTRSVSSAPNNENEVGNLASQLDMDSNKSGTAFYVGPFSSLALRLKRVSLTTCFVGTFGLPAALFIKHGSAVPMGGQLAVAGTAAFAAVGSTLLLSYCFNPYVHKLEYVDPETGAPVDNNAISEKDKTALHIRATTRTLLSTELQTVFDPVNDVTVASSVRPFCNFVAAGVPMYCHPEILSEQRLLKVISAKSNRSHA